ncbi:MAG: DUF5719 family protein, partial [Acidimicrobiales bacterium]
MARERPVALAAVLALVLAATAVASAMAHSSNPSSLPNALSVAGDAESTALYCTGLSGAGGGAAGVVSFLNTQPHARTLSVSVVSDAGQRVTRRLTVAPTSTARVSPSSWLAGHSYGVEAVVDGGGVVAEEVGANASALAPCVSGGVTSWYASGFDTKVGSSAVLSFFNPTATPAVIDVTTYTSTGYAAPAPFQGFAVGAHDQVEINLGAQIVNTDNVGVGVSVVRGAVAVLGVQRSGAVTSFMTGSAAPSTVAWFPQVTTAAAARAEIRLTNPSSQPADVTVAVSLGSFHVVPRTVTVAARATGLVTITPNPAIPAAGFASLRVRSSQPVVAALATGSAAGLSLSAPTGPRREFLVSDFSGRGFATATVTNVSARPVAVSLRALATPGSSAATATATVAGGATVSLRALFADLGPLHGRSLFVGARRP